MGFTPSKTKGKSEITNFEFTGLIDYARVHEPSYVNSKAGQYSLSIRLENSHQVEKFLELMKQNNISEIVFNPKTKKDQSRLKDNGDGTYSVSLKRDAVNSQGKHATIDVVDSQGNNIPKTVMIGNGSKGTVHGFIYQGDDGGVMRLSGLQIIDLVPFTSSKFKALPTGFVVGTTMTQETDGDQELQSSVF